MDINCPFCQELDSIEDSEFRSFFPKQELPSRIVRRTENFVALAGLGALRRGYLLVLPKDHYTSFSALGAALFTEAEDIKDDLVNLLREKLLHSIVFEHGSTQSNRAGGCIEHAHIHILPTKVNLFPKLSQLFKPVHISHFRDLHSSFGSQNPYLYYEDCEHRCAFVVNESLPSQYLRRMVYEEEGIPDDWDWMVFPEKQNVIRTVDLFRERPWAKE